MRGASRRAIISDEDRARIVRLYVDEQLSMDALAERFAVGGSAIKATLLRAGVTLRPAVRGIGAAAASAERLAEIRRRWSAGESLQQIAQALGTTSTAIYHAARRLRLPRRA